MRPLPEFISTARLNLRRPELFDASAIFNAYTQDRDVCKYMIWKPHTSAQATHDFIQSRIDAWSAGDRLPFIITESTSNLAIGMIEARVMESMIDVGYVLAKAHWGKGLMPEAVLAVTAAALANDRLYRVQATCDTENIPSQRTLEKAGFAREGRLERHTILPNLSTEPRASFIYAKCR